MQEGDARRAVFVIYDAKRGCKKGSMRDIPMMQEGMQEGQYA